MYTDGHCQILSSGVSIPEQIRTSENIMEEIDSENRFGIPKSALERSTGIASRRVVTNEDYLPSMMAADAAKQALEMSSTRPKDIQMIIYAGVIRDHVLEPSTAHKVQDIIGAKNAMVVDLNNACLGFMSAIHIMDALIATGQVTRGLIVTGEQGSRFTKKAIGALKNTHDKKQFHDLLAGLTLGDAGAALVLGPKSRSNPEFGFQGFNMHSEGQFSQLCYCGDPMEEGVLITKMSGILAEGSRLSTKTFTELLTDRLKWQNDELDHFIGHQVGKGTHNLYTKKFKINREIMSETVWDHGNIITATIPVNLHKLSSSQKFKEGNKVFLAGAGSGVCTGHAGMIWGSSSVH